MNSADLEKFWEEKEFSSLTTLGSHDFFKDKKILSPVPMEVLEHT